MAVSFFHTRFKGGEEGEEKGLREEMMETRIYPGTEVEAGGKRDEVVLSQKH